jgi:glutaredoxin
MQYEQRRTPLPIAPQPVYRSGMDASLGFLSGHELAVYSTNGCPDCTRLEHWLDERRVAYRKVMIDGDPSAADRLERETGLQAVPFVLVDDRAWVRGYHNEEPSRLSEAKFLNELRAALGNGA